MKMSALQDMILKQTGIKTSVKKGSGSLKVYFIISPMFQNGLYPEFPFEWRRNLVAQYPETEPTTISANGTQIMIHVSIVEDDRINFKKERKPKPIEERKVKQWGSKNSQVRLDKKAASYAKKLRQGKDVPRYY